MITIKLPKLNNKFTLAKLPTLRLQRWFLNFPKIKKFKLNINFSSKKFRIFRLFLALIVFPLLAISIGYWILNPKVVHAWYDDAFLYRQKITLNNTSGSPLTDYQTPITIDTSTLITAGKMRSDCGDIRLTDVNGIITTQPYWVERCNTTTTRVFIKHASLAAGTTIMYLYYSSSNSTSLASSGDLVFDYFESFNGLATGADISTATDWTKSVTNGSTYTIDSERLKMYHPASAPNESQDQTVLTLPTEFTSNVVAEVNVTVANSNSWDFLYVSGDSGTSRGDTATTALWSAINDENWQGYSGSWSVAKYGLTVDSTYTLGGAYYFSTDTAKMYLDGTYRIDRTFGDTGTTGLKKLIFANYGYSSVDTTWYVDEIKVRQLASTEPTIVNSSEEKGPAPVAYWKFDEGTNRSLDQPITKQEQKINIMNQTYATGSGSAVPTDNSLGIVHWDADKYPNSTVYFEVVMKRSNNGFPHGVTTLYTTGGSAIASVSHSDGSPVNTYERFRTTALTLTDDTDYTARVYTTGSEGNITTTKSASLIVVQNNSSGLTSTQTQIEMGYPDTTTSTSATQIVAPKIYYYDSTKFNPSPATHLDATIKSSQMSIEQQINIIDQEYSAALDENESPTDNSLGIIHWDDDLYSNETVYFEAVIRVQSQGLSFGRARLYSTDGSLATSVAIPADSGIGMQSYQRFRSNAVSLTDDTDYTVRINEGGAGSNTVYIIAARLIIIQSSTTGITDTQTQVEIGNNQAGFTNTSYSELTDPKIYQYDQDKFTPTPESSADVEFHASIKVADTGDTVHAALVNKTSGNTVAEVSRTSSTAWNLEIATNVDGDADWDTTNDDDYVVQVKCTDGNGGGCSGSISNAKLVFKQTDASNKISKVETIFQLVNTLRTDSDGTYTSQTTYNSINNDLEVSQVSFAGGTFTYFFESTIKTTASTTGYSQLYNTTAGSAITSSEVTTTSTSYERARSSDITSNMPVYPTQIARQTLDTQIKNSTTSTTSTADSRLIIQISSLATTSISATADVYNLTDSLQVSGSEATTSSTSWTLASSGTFSLTTGKEYVVRIKTSVGGGRITISNAKIVHDQTDSSSKVKSVESTIQMINAVVTDADSTYTSQIYYGRYDPTVLSMVSNYNSSAVYFETTMKTNNGSNAAYSILRNVTAGSNITGSEVTTSSTTYARARSSSDITLNMPTTAANTDTQVKNASTSTTTVSSSWIVIQNTNSIQTVAKDSSVNSNNGNLANNPTWITECKFDNCLDFDGSNDYVKVPDAGTLDFAATESFTISGWFKHIPQTSGTDVILAKYLSTSGTDGGYKIYMESDGDITFGIDDDQTSFPEDFATSTAATYDDNTWHLFTAVKTSNTRIDLYIDGLLVGSDTSLSATGTLANSDSLYIGIDGDETSNLWDGQLDEIKIYPYAMEIKPRSVSPMAGGTVTESGGYRIHTFTESGTLEVNVGQTVEVLVVAGGGGGGKAEANSSGDGAGGGGAGGLIYNASYSLSSGTKTVTVGGGGAGTTSGTYPNIQRGAHGSDSVFATLTAVGGGGGGSDNDDPTGLNKGADGGSGGGASNRHSVAVAASSGTSGQGNAGGDALTNTTTWRGGSGGGGAGAVGTTRSGTTGGAGGVGLSYSVSGGAVFYAGGGGGGGSSTTGGAGGNGGGGAGGNSAGTGTAGTANTGGGGGGGGANNGSGGSGGSGVVIIRYLLPVGAVAYNYKNVVTSGFSSAFGLSERSPLQDGLVGYWKVDETASPATDSSGNSGSGTWTASPTNGAGKFGQAISVASASSQYITVTDSSPLSPTSKVTLSAWINPTTTIASKGIVVKDQAYRMTTNASSQLVCEIYSGGAWQTAATGATTLTTGVWQLTSCTYDGAKVTAYVNGAQNGQSAVSNAINDSSTALEVGRNISTDYFNGKIDDVRIYNRSLGASEISQIYSWSPTPVAWWKMDENTGSKAYDSSGNSNNSSDFTGNVTWVPARFGAGLYFDGDGDVARAVDATTIDLGATTDSYSIEGWFKTSTNFSANATITAKDDGSGAYPFSLYLDSSEFGCFQISDGTFNPSVCGSTALNDGKWHHLSGIRNVDTDLLYLYVDGVQINSATDTTTATAVNNDDASIGNSGTSYVANDFNGLIDDVRIYSYARNSGQVINDMNAGHPAPGSPVGSAVAYWNFDEGYGTTAHDSSSNANDLTLNTSTWTSSGKFSKAWNGTGVDTRLSRATDPDLEFSATDSFTISVWFKSDSATNSTKTEYLLADGGPSATAGYSIYIPTSGAFCFGIDDDTSWGPDTSTCTGEDYYDNQWHHVVGVRNVSTDTIKIYIDGSQKDSDPDITTGTLDSSPTFFIGDIDTDIGGAGEEFAGDIDEVKVYRSALTAEQVKVEFNRGASQSLGALSTTATGISDNSSTRSYCPPGDTAASCVPVGNFMFDENSGITTYDDTGQNLVGTLNSMGPDNWVKGKNGSALKFDGNSDFVDFGLNTIGPKLSGVAGVTFSAWIKLNAIPTAGNTYQIFAVVNSTGGSVEIRIDENAKVNAGGRSTAGDAFQNAISTTALSTGQWYFVAATFDYPNDSIKIYLNSVLDKTQSVTFAATSYTNSAHASLNDQIGNFEGQSRYFSGVLDQVRLFPILLSQKEIVWDYSIGAPLVSNRFDECQGSTAYNSAFAASGGAAGNNATITIGASGSNTTVGACSSGTGTEAWNNGTTGKRNASLDFDGTDDYVATGNVALIVPDTVTYSAISWGEWINPSSAPTSDTLIHKNNEFRLTTDSTDVAQCEIYASAAWQSAKAVTNSPIAASSWTHILCTYDGANLRIYRNGQLEQTTAQTNNITSSASTALNIGRDSASSGYFDGQIDDTKIFNYTLSNIMTKTLFNSGAVSFIPTSGPTP